MPKDIRELTNDPEAYAAELEQRWTGLLSYRYIGRNHSSMNTGAVDNTVTLRRDMRNAAGGLLVAPLSISAPEGDVGSDLVAVPNPVIHSCLILDDARDVARIEVVDSEVLRSGARMGYSRSMIVDADDHDRVIAFTEGQGVRIGIPPEGLEKMPEAKLEIVDSPDLPPLWQAFGASRRDDGHWVAARALRRVGLARRRLAHRTSARRPRDRRDQPRRRTRRHGVAPDADLARHVPRPGEGGPLPGRWGGSARRRGQGGGPTGPPRRGRRRSSRDVGVGLVLDRRVGAEQQHQAAGSDRCRCLRTSAFSTSPTTARPRWLRCIWVILVPK